MIAKKTYATAPAPLSSIFSPKILRDDEMRKVDQVGARGGGFTLCRGVETRAEYFPGEEDENVIYVNDLRTDFVTSLRAIEVSRRRLGLKGRIVLRHRVHVPIGTGFGTSASIALTTLLTLFRIAGRGITLREACRIVHEIEVKCKTGLNSEAGFLSEGLILVVKEGAPPKVEVNSIPIPHGSMMISVVASPLDTSGILSKTAELRRIEEIGDRKIEEILRKPTPENFLRKSKEFAWEAGFATEKAQEFFEVFERLPVIGYAQNMIGEAYHALVLEKNAEKVKEELKETFPEYRVITSEVNGLIRSSTEP